MHQPRSLPKGRLELKMDEIESFWRFYAAYWEIWQLAASFNCAAGKLVIRLAMGRVGNGQQL